MKEKILGSTVPLLTVAMPIFNAGHHLRLAVLSIVNQSFKNWELIIYDDGSTDNAVQSLVDINDPRIRIINDGLNKGLAARLNEIIDLAGSQYFSRMDQDDVSYPNRFEEQLMLLQKNSKLDVVAASAITISEDNEITGLLPCPISHDNICARPWQGFCFPHPTWMGKTAWFKRFKYAIPGPYFCEDQELLLRSYTKSRFGASEEILFAYRVKNNWNLSRVLKTRWILFQIQRSHFNRAEQKINVVFSGFFYMALIARDLWWYLNNNSYKSKKDIPSSILFIKESSKWKIILGLIKSNKYP